MLRIFAHKGKRHLCVNTSHLTKTCDDLERSGYTIERAETHKAKGNDGKRLLRKIERAFG